MNEDLIHDLKQFIEATVSQNTADLATKEDLKLLATKVDMNRLEQKLEKKIDDIRKDFSKA